MTGPGLLLAIDAGGSSTRAVLTTRDGRCSGYGTGPAGNPTSAGPDAAMAAMSTAAGAAARQAEVSLDGVEAVMVAMAGVRTLLDPADLARTLGFTGPLGQLRTTGDVAATYFSGTVEPAGCVVVAGTGSCAGQVRGGVVVRSVGGSGWLLGDGGSGFAVGHAVVRAVVAQLEGTGPATALTALLLDDLGIAHDGALTADGRPTALGALVPTLYRGRPVALARYAPLAFAALGDPVADGIVAGAQDALAALITAVRADAWVGPLVMGGGTVSGGLLAPGVARTLALRLALEGADVRLVRDGAVGAAALALTAETSRLDDAGLDRLRAGVEALRTA